MKKIKYIFCQVPYVVFWNILLVFICYAVCRLEFLCENWTLFQPSMTCDSTINLFYGGLIFDGSAITYLSLLYLVLVLFPLHWKECSIYKKIVKLSFILPNSVGIVANLIDSVYFPFNQQRATAIIFDEFHNESNLLKIFCAELSVHWYLVLLVSILIYALWKLYLPTPIPDRNKPLRTYYLRYGLSLLLFTFLAICAIRGKYFDTQSRPIAINDAHKYATTPQQTAVVLNTPFAIFRTLFEKPMQLPTYYEDTTILDNIYSPLHEPRKDRKEKHKNICILIVESFAQEFIGALTNELDNGTYKGYTPFVDELIGKSLTWRETFCNGGISIDAMPAILASIPRMDRPYVLQPFSLNEINSIVTELKHWGYQSAFFHGAPNGSMGFEAFANSIGFNNYFGMTEYCDDKRFGGKTDFDGTWAIWDEPFLQFYAQKMTEMKEPFVTTCFTASSHHPFNVPEQYRDTFPNEGQFEIHKCIRYTDYSLRRFFETASKQSWYKNTIFVLTADHASGRVTHDEYKTMVGIYRVPLLFFDPSGEMPVGCQEGIAQHIDIMPTLLGYLGYDRPYIAFGQDLLNTLPENMWAFNWSHIPQLIQGDYSLLFDGQKVKGLFDYRHDVLMKKDLRGKCPKEKDMERRLKALLQSYMQRMKNNEIVIR